MSILNFAYIIISHMHMFILKFITISRHRLILVYVNTMAHVNKIAYVNPLVKVIRVLQYFSLYNFHSIRWHVEVGSIISTIG